VVGIDRDADCATTRSDLAAVRYRARTFPAILTFGASVRTWYDPSAGALKLVVYEPYLLVVALTMPTQRFPDLRWTHTGREYTPGSFPLALTLSALIAVEGANRMYGRCAATTREGEATDRAP
jgi:hypothetical protein